MGIFKNKKKKQWKLFNSNRKKYLKKAGPLILKHKLARSAIKHLFGNMVEYSSKTPYVKVVTRQGKKYQVEYNPTKQDKKYGKIVKYIVIFMPL